MGENIAVQSDENTYPGYDDPRPVVVIKPEAYLTMLKHVLRFGSMAKDKSQYRECMGMLMGKLGKKKGLVHDVIVVDAIPVTNGSHIEVSFDEMDYVKFADINAEYAEQGTGIFNVGWYHSHPGLTVFLSTVDVQNHLGFQTTNPSAIAIVWDHQLLEQKDENGEYDIGFETFRLTEISKGKHSDYTTVKTIVMPPTDLKFYKLAIKDIIDHQNAGEPPIFEISELPSIIGDFYPQPVDEQKFEPPQVSFSYGDKPDVRAQIDALSTGFLAPLQDFLNKWAGSAGAAMKNQSVLLYRNIRKLSESIEKRVQELQKWFSSKANDVFYDLWSEADTMLEERINQITPVLKDVEEKVLGGPVEKSPDSFDGLLNRIKELANKSSIKKEGD